MPTEFDPLFSKGGASGSSSTDIFKSSVAFSDEDNPSDYPSSASRLLGDDDRDITGSGGRSSRYNSSRDFICFFIPLHWIDSYEYDLDEQKNGLFSTIALMINSMIGSGILFQSYMFSQAGILNATFVYIAVGCFTYFGVELLLRSADNVKIFDYSALASLCYGTFGEVTFDSMVVLQNCGCVISYVLLIGIMTVDIFFSVFDREGEPNKKDEDAIKFFSSCLIFAVAGPLCLIRNFGRLTYVSYFAVCAIWASVLVVSFRFFISFASNTSSTNTVLVSSVPGTCETLGSVVFAFGFSTVVFHSYGAVGSSIQSASRFEAVLKIVCILGVSLCYITGLLGYLTFGADTQSNILENFPGLVGLFIKIPFIVHLSLVIVGDFLVLRHSLYRLLGTDIRTVSNVYYISTTLLVFLSLLLIALILQLFMTNNDSLTLVLDLTGGVSGSILNFVLPALIGHKLVKATNANLVKTHMLLLAGIVVPVVVIVSAVREFVLH